MILRANQDTVEKRKNKKRKKKEEEEGMIKVQLFHIEMWLSFCHFVKQFKIRKLHYLKLGGQP